MLLLIIVIVVVNQLLAEAFGRLASDVNDASQLPGSPAFSSFASHLNPLPHQHLPLGRFLPPLTPTFWDPLQSSVDGGCSPTVSGSPRCASCCWAKGGGPARALAAEDARTKEFLSAQRAMCLLSLVRLRLVIGHPGRHHDLFGQGVIR